MQYFKISLLLNYFKIFSFVNLVLNSFNRRCPHYQARWSHSLNSLDLDSWLIQPTLHCPETTWVHLGIFHSLPGPGLISAVSLVSESTNIWRFAWVHTQLLSDASPLSPAGLALQFTLMAIAARCLHCFSDICKISQSHWKPGKWFKSPVSPPSCQI